MRTLRTLDSRSPRRRKSAPGRLSQNPVRLALEAMEDRTVPAQVTALGPDGLNLTGFGAHHSAQAGGTLYFLAATGTGNPTLWQTDGTPARTAAAGAAGLAGLSVSEVASADGSVYFAAAPGNDWNNQNVYKLDTAAPNGVTRLTQFAGKQGLIDLEVLG